MLNVKLMPTHITTNTQAWEYNILKWDLYTKMRLAIRLKLFIIPYTANYQVVTYKGLILGLMYIYYIKL